uniref:Uncharacterized protein n=1 Tax=Oryza barthii TaxID=65489 RepID=A0A0D3GZZ8_9ORYZ
MVDVAEVGKLMSRNPSRRARMGRRRVVVDAQEGVMDQGCTGDDDGDPIAAVIEEDDAKEPM